MLGSLKIKGCLLQRPSRAISTVAVLLCCVMLSARADDVTPIGTDPGNPITGPVGGGGAQPQNCGDPWLVVTKKGKKKITCLVDNPCPLLQTCKAHLHMKFTSGGVATSLTCECDSWFEKNPNPPIKITPYSVD